MRWCTGRSSGSPSPNELLPAAPAGVPALPHVEDECLTAATDRGGLDHQLVRLLDGHEVLGHRRVGYRDWTAADDLHGEAG